MLNGSPPRDSCRAAGHAHDWSRNSCVCNLPKVKTYIRPIKQVEDRYQQGRQRPAFPVPAGRQRPVGGRLQGKSPCQTGTGRCSDRWDHGDACRRFKSITRRKAIRAIPRLNSTNLIRSLCVSLPRLVNPKKPAMMPNCWRSMPCRISTANTPFRAGRRRVQPGCQQEQRRLDFTFAARPLADLCRSAVWRTALFGHETRTALWSDVLFHNEWWIFRCEDKTQGQAVPL